MTKARYRRPADPQAIAELKRVRLERLAEIQRLSVQPDMRVVTDSAHRLVVAHRQDVFDVFAARRNRDDKPLITQDQLAAVRRLERDMARAEGVDRESAAAIRVDEGPKCALDYRLDAKSRIAAVTGLMPIASAGLICDLLGPQFSGQIPEWRRIVALHTAERDKDVQSYILRAACADLMAAYVRMDASTSRPSAAAAVASVDPRGASSMGRPISAMTKPAIARQAPTHGNPSARAS